MIENYKILLESCCDVDELLKMYHLLCADFINANAVFCESLCSDCPVYQCYFECKENVDL